MMTPGTLIGGRFEIEGFAARGGMGLVYRARDRQTGQLVALKMRRPEARSQNTERLLREAQVLSELRHPGIAAYIGHGRMPEGQIFLAMEWLQGEDLAERLRQQRLTLDESLTLVRRVASTLAVVHQRGFVHRDIKPSNLLLRNGQVELVTLLDFGVARGGLFTGDLTGTGEVVGSLHYMSPEQARGERKVMPSTDIFSLGCVLYECLTGSPPFSGEHVAVMLMRILHEEVPPLRASWPELPAALERLLAQMLAKQPEERYADGTALCEVLAGLDLATDDPSAPRAAAPPAPSLVLEQQLVSVVLALPPGPTDKAVAPPGTDDSTLLKARAGALERLLQPLSARVEHLANGTIVATLTLVGQTAQDQAMQAARVASLLKANAPESTVVVATGRGTMKGRLPAGEVLERALRLVGQEGGSAWVWMDALTGQLLDGRFTTRRLETGVYALEDQVATAMGDPSRPLLGKPTPCVGRERELQFLGMMYRTCAEESVARAVLVVAAPGVGKSRLRHEFLRRLQGEGQDFTLLIGSGDPMHAGTAYGPLGEALRRWSGIEETAAPEGRQGQLAAAVGRLLGPQEGSWVAEFLGELCGLAFPDEQSPQLRAARQEPRMMSDQVAAAFVTWLQAECAKRPVLLILEDLHWGDAATVRLVDIALRELGGQGFFVLALARPEIQQLFPKLWEEREIQTLRFGELGRRASERLIRETLGAEVPPEVVERITTQAGGNALYLEELIRAVAEGSGEALPETLLSMLQARFLRLDTGARRLLRAASMFGQTFWRDGVLELLGHESRAVHDIDRWLEILVDSEVIARQAPSRFAGEAQFGFRHGLLRDAAYSLLNEEDRRQGHFRAGQFLERAGEDDPLVLAEHYERGSALERAAAYHARAAQRALDGQDTEGALRMAERGIACGASGRIRGQLRCLQGWACIWSRQHGEALELAREAFDLLPEGSVEWFRSVGAILVAAGFLARLDLVNELIPTLLRAPLEPGAGAAFMEASIGVMFMTSSMGMREIADQCLRRMQEVGSGLDGGEVYARGLLHLMAAWHALSLTGDAWSYRCSAQEAIVCLAAAGDRRHLYMSEIYRHVAEAHLGNFEPLRAEFQSTLAEGDRLHEPILSLLARVLLGMVLLNTGEPQDRAEARALAETALARSTEPDLGTWIGYVVLARVHTAEGELAAAEENARKALDGCRGMPLLLLLASPVLIRILLLQGRIEEAQAVATRGMQVLASQGGTSWTDVRLCGAAAEAFHAAGDREAARQAAGAAWGLVERRAAGIPDPAVRERYLALSDSVRARELAERSRELPGN